MRIRAVLEQGAQCVGEAEGMKGGFPRVGALRAAGPPVPSVAGRGVALPAPEPGGRGAQRLPLPRRNGLDSPALVAPSALVPAWTLPLQAAPVTEGARRRRCAGGHVTARGGAGAGAAAGRRGGCSAMSLRERSPGGAVEAGEDAAAALAEPDGPDRCLSLLPWDRFSAWLHCVCVVGFDLELGQAVEVREAAGARWPPGFGGARGAAHASVGLWAPFPPGAGGSAAGPRRNRALPLVPALHGSGGSSAVFQEKCDCAKSQKASEGRERASVRSDIAERAGGSVLWESLCQRDSCHGSVR